VISCQTLCGALAAVALIGTALAEPLAQDEKVELISTRYQSVGNCGVVLDRQTKLMWQRCAFGQMWDGKTCVGRSTRVEWDLATLWRDEHCGFADWHLPELIDLEGLVAEGGIPQIDQAAFPNTPPGSFWTASTANVGVQKAWYVDFGGFGPRSNFKDSRYYVRFVREAK